MKCVSFSLYFVLAACAACSAPTARERIEDAWYSRGSPAVDSALIFSVDRDRPERPVEHWEFYYKHCTMDQHKLVSDNAEYQCTDPY